MKQLSAYKIPYLGLKLGKHLFDFEIDDTFFEHFEHHEEDLTNFKVFLDIELEKQSTMINIVFKFAGSVDGPCDRCGDLVELEIDGEEKLVVQYGDTNFSEHTDDILVLSSKEHEIDLSPYIYEYILVSLPFSRVHEEMDDCNPDVIKRLNELSQEAPDEEPTDERWDALTKYKNE